MTAIQLDPALFGADSACFGCSPTHPIGFHLRFEKEDDVVRTRFVPHQQLQGPPGIMHGGLVTTLGDEIATCSFTILCGGGSAHLATAMAGTWDAAELTVSRVFPAATLVRFRGFVADVRPSATQIEIVGKSLLMELK